MKRLMLAAFAAMSVVAFAETKVGIIGLDTSHAIAFTKMMNVEKPEFCRDFRVSDAYQFGSRDIFSSTNRYPKYIAEVKAMGVTLRDSIADLLKEVDVVLLETNDGRPHLEQATEVFKSGKLMFIDKPIAHDYADAKKIVETAKAYNAKWFCASSLRYTKTVKEAHEGILGAIRGAVTWSPEEFEEHHSDYYWYGIHGVDPLFAMMGRGCVSVSCVSSADGDVLTGRWKDGRLASVRLMQYGNNLPYSCYGGAVFLDGGKKATMLDDYRGYRPLLETIVEFFKTGVVPIDPEETLEVYGFMDAAVRSKRLGGEEVKIGSYAASGMPSKETFICHRGESFDAPENTLPAYKMAVDRGFGFECDIYLSKDKRLFTFHDSSLARTTGGACKKKCSEASWEDEVSKLDVGGWGKWKGSKYSPTRPALLEEVLELARDGRYIYVEVKSGVEAVPYIKEVFDRQTNAHPGNALFICFNAAVCRELKRVMPEYKVYWLSSSGYKDGKDGPWLPVQVDNLLAMLKQSGADGIDCHFNRNFITEEMIRKIRDAGYEFHAWTIDDIDNARLAFKRGAQTVTTNCALKLLNDNENLK